MRLVQIAGGGRIRLEEAKSGRTWWTRPPSGVAWEVYVADRGQRYRTQEEAEQVAVNLAGSSPTG
jgi:hypothetical protein